MNHMHSDFESFLQARFPHKALDKYIQAISTEKKDPLWHLEFLVLHLYYHASQKDRTIMLSPNDVAESFYPNRPKDDINTKFIHEITEIIQEFERMMFLMRRIDLDTNTVHLECTHVFLDWAKNKIAGQAVAVHETPSVETPTPHQVSAKQMRDVECFSVDLSVARCFAKSRHPLTECGIIEKIWMHTSTDIVDAIKTLVEKGVLEGASLGGVVYYYFTKEFVDVLNE